MLDEVHGVEIYRVLRHQSRVDAAALVLLLLLLLLLHRRGSRSGGGGGRMVLLLGCHFLLVVRVVRRVRRRHVGLEGALNVLVAHAKVVVHETEMERSVVD